MAFFEGASASCFPRPAELIELGCQVRFKLSTLLFDKANRRGQNRILFNISIDRAQISNPGDFCNKETTLSLVPEGRRTSMRRINCSNRDMRQSHSINGQVLKSWKFPCCDCSYIYIWSNWWKMHHRPPSSADGPGVEGNDSLRDCGCTEKTVRYGKGQMLPVSATRGPSKVSSSTSSKLSRLSKCPGSTMVEAGSQLRPG